MASIRRETVIDAAPDLVWDALRDVGAIHERLAPGFVREVKLEPGARLVSFGNGMVVRERIVAVDEAERRVAWSATGGRLEHHNASAQVLDEGDGRSRFVWIADLLPDEIAPAIAAMIEQGLGAIQKTLEAAGGRRR
jgi:carbon monoxide dehydrogenase subunit G